MLGRPIPSPEFCRGIFCLGILEFLEGILWFTEFLIPTFGKFTFEFTFGLSLGLTFEFTFELIFEFTFKFAFEFLFELEDKTGEVLTTLGCFSGNGEVTI